MTIRGVIRGKTIELEHAPRLLEGQTVDVTVRPAPMPRGGVQGILASAGLLASENSAEDDRILQEIQEDREASCSRELPE